MSRRKNKGRLSPFVAVTKSTINTPAWKVLSHGARSLYVAIKGRYNTNLQNGVYLSTRQAAKELGPASKKDAIARWFRELMHYGFIVMVSGAYLGVEGKGKAPHYRLTEEWYLNKPPTREFMDWQGDLYHEQKSAKYYKRRERRLEKLLAKQRRVASPSIVSAVSPNKAVWSSPVIEELPWDDYWGQYYKWVLLSDNVAGSA